jgi:hypothetical protein
MGGSQRKIERFAVACDNMLNVSFYNSATASFITPTGRALHFGVTTPYTSAELDIYTTAINDTTRVDGYTDFALSMTRGGQSTVFSPAVVKWQATPPSIFGKRDKIQLDQYWRAYRTVSADLLTVTNDPTV